jgi:uncharacterized repeat protein (TIGR01451 family)
MPRLNRLSRALCWSLVAAAVLWLPGLTAGAATAPQPAHPAARLGALLPVEAAAPAASASFFVSYPSGPLVPPEAGLGPGSVDNSTATTTFGVLPGDLPDGAVVEEVSVEIVFAKVGGGGCPGPGGDDDYAEEVRFRLVAPDGTSVTLVRYNDYWYSNPDVGQVSVTFDDDAPTSVVGLPIQSGTFQPSGGAMADFAGVDPAANGGVWTLQIADNDAVDPICFSSATLYITAFVEADLALTKSDGPDPVVAGNNLTYSLTVTNNGPSVAENVLVEDSLPGEVEVVSVSGSGPGGPAGCAAGTPGDPLDLTGCAFGPLASGQQGSMTVVVRVRPDAVTDPVTDQTIVQNDAWAISDTFDPDTSDNFASQATTVQAQADLGLEKFALGPSPWIAGEVRSFEVDLVNLGPSVARDVTLRDDLPPELELVSAYVLAEGVPGGVPLACAVAGNNVVLCPLGDVPPTDTFPGGGSPVAVLLNVRVRPGVPDGTMLTNNASVFSDTPDPNGANDTAQTQALVSAQADLEILATGEPAIVTAGEQVRVTITVTNYGPSDAQSVVVTHTLPLSVSHQVDTGGCTLVGSDPDVLQCELGTLGAGETRAFDVWAGVDPAITPGTVAVADARVASLTDDPEPANDVAQAETLVVGQADLRVTKFGKPGGVVRAGENLTYTVIVDNLGPGYAHDVVVDDLVQSDGTFEFVLVTSNRLSVCTPSPGTYSERLELHCELAGPLEVMTPEDSGRWILTLVVRADEPQIVSNVASVVGSDPDPDLSNNQAVVEHEVTEASDLGIVKTAFGQVQVDGQPAGTFALVPDEVTAGGTMTYTLTVANFGPSTAENVVVQDRLPPWIEVTSAAPSQGRCLTGTPGDPTVPQTCNLGTLASGRSATVTVVVAVPSWVPSGTVLYDEALVLSDVFDPNNANDFDTNLTSVNAWADLALTKVQQPPLALPGQEITYVVTVRNLGPSDASGAAVTDVLPAGLAGATWECAPTGDAVCAAGGWGDVDDTVDLPAGGVVVYTVGGTLASPHQVTNSATAIPPLLVPDPDGSNNSASVVNSPLTLFLPLAANGDGVVAAPDLVVDAILATSTSVEVVVRNAGEVPILDSFWVDLYVGPSLAPRTVNQLWSDLGDEGIVWGVSTGALPLEPGGTVILSVDDDHYWPALSRVSWPLSAGTSLYAQVDSYGPSTAHGLVLEDHEVAGGAYNNILGPVTVAAAAPGGSPAGAAPR